uniref:Uncharacterized protein n=1 Tax=Anguilla anguilla TaxID=7936 RepID=A0A0E9UVT0_ANGAN
MLSRAKDILLRTRIHTQAPWALELKTPFTAQTLLCVYCSLTE